MNKLTEEAKKVLKQLKDNSSLSIIVDLQHPLSLKDPEYFIYNSFNEKRTIISKEIFVSLRDNNKINIIPSKVVYSQFMNWELAR